MANQGLALSQLDFRAQIAREWLVANGIGGFASSTIPGLNTRKYHGLLVAAMAPPVRRMVLLSRVEETIYQGRRGFELASNEYPGVIHPRGFQFLRAFSHEPFPRWAYQGEGWTIEKQVRLLKGENTVVVSYILLCGDRACELDVRPAFALRPMHELGYQWNGRLQAVMRSACHWQVPPTSRTPEVFFAHSGRFTPQADWFLNTIYRREQERGYAGLEDLWTPGSVRMNLSPGQAVHFVCSSDPIDFDSVVARAAQQDSGALSPAARPPATTAKGEPDSALDALARAADAFIVEIPSGGGRSTGCVTRYPWAAPSGRDTLIALPGLLLTTGRFAEARSLLLFYASLLQQGLMPSAFPESGAAPLYEGADVSLWFINAVYEYLRYTREMTSVARQLIDVVFSILSSYRAGTGLGIHTDDEGLIAAHSPEAATTWMDAKVGQWVVTPRGGRAVELNALWYNAQCAASEMAGLVDQKDRADALSAAARLTREGFNRRFWNEASRCCFDTVDDHGRDPSVRPNQIFAISLPFPVLCSDRHAAVLARVQGELLTPFGLRTLSPRVPGYEGHYRGDVGSRDRAAHNGSVFPWLMGPFVSAFLRVRGHGPTARAEARLLIQPLLDRLTTDGLGQLCEMFDGDAPHDPAGATASAAAVAELLRCLCEDILDLNSCSGPLTSAPPPESGLFTPPPGVTNRA